MARKVRFSPVGVVENRRLLDDAFEKPHLLVTLEGPAGVGKSTFAELFRRWLEEVGIGVAIRDDDGAEDDHDRLRRSKKSALIACVQLGAAQPAPFLIRIRTKVVSAGSRRFRPRW